MPGTLLVLEPESSGHELINAALALDLDVHVISSRPFAHPQAGRRLDGTVTDGAPASMVKAALEIAERRTVVGVAPGFEYAVPSAAIAAALLNLPGAGTRSGLGELLQNKDSMHAALSRAGVPTAAGVSFDLAQATPDALARLAGTVGFPAVVKPVDGSGSLRVRRVDDRESLERLLAHYAAQGPLQDLGRQVGHRVRLETYVEGPEISVEGYVTAHEPHVVAVTQKRLGPEPHFVEIGHVVPAPLPRPLRNTVEVVTHAAVLALGLETGTFHLEARLTPRGPVVIEMGARLGGDRIPELVSLATGFSLPDAAVRLLTGLPVPPQSPATKVAGIRLFTVPAPSRLPDPAELQDRLLRLPGCAEAVVNADADTLLLPATDFRQRFGHAVLTAPDHTALDAELARVDLLVEQAVVPTLPVAEGALPCAS